MSLQQQQQQQQQQKLLTEQQEGDKKGSNHKSISLLQRNSTSQLLQHASRLGGGLRRSRTTKVFSTSPQLLSQAPRPISSSSTSSFSNYHQKTAAPLQLKEYTPPSPLPDDMFNATRAMSIGTVSTTTTRILSSIPENRQQATFKMTSKPTGTTTTQQQPHYYRAFLSSIAFEFKRRIILADRIKNDIEYHNVFDGKEAVDKLKLVIGTTDRTIALKIGRALESQRIFHDVNYENRLIDDVLEIYQFNELIFHNATNNNNTVSTFCSHSSSEASFSVTSSTVVSDGYDDEDDEAEEEEEEDEEQSLQQQQINNVNDRNTSLPLPNGIYVDLTHCYSPTCDYTSPCYSYTCPKRQRLRHRPHSVDTREKRVTAYIYEVEKYQPLWSQTIDDYIVLSTPTLERKRQETIFELIYTEENFQNDLDYVIKLWIDPLKTSDIIPKNRRDDFIDQVFSNLLEIRNISSALCITLRARQEEHPIVSHISDIMEQYVNQFEPFVYYGARQHQAKHIYEHERFNNPRFALFAEQTERDVASRKLELNGYLTKPTTRLGRYTLLLDKIHARTTFNHPDKENIPYIINKIKHLLQRVNVAAGQAKNRFDLEQIHRHLSFKNKRDVMDLKLLQQGRSIIRQGTMRKTAQIDSSTEYQVILFDHYLVIAKVKMVHAVEHYRIQKRPIPIELLGINLSTLAENNGSHLQRKRSASTLLFSNSPMITTTTSSAKISPSSATLLDNNQILNNNNVQRLGVPITFYHQGSNVDDTLTLYAPSDQNRKAWSTLIQKQRDIKFKRKPIFDMMDVVKRFEFFSEITIHHMVTFFNNDQLVYMLATDAGIYLGPYASPSGIPRKILPLENATQVHILEDYQLLLVLANHVLWQYPLDITIQGQDNAIIQNFGRKIRTHVPFFHVGQCRDQILICVPKPASVNGTEIDLYEPTMPTTELRKKSLLTRWSSIRSSASLSLINTQVIPLKSIYSPCEVWAIDNTKSMLLLTTPLGMIAVDMKTKKADALLDPSDKHLTFITKHEQIDKQMIVNPVIKHISVFPVSNGNYLMCYDRYAFYIDKKGRRTKHKFKIQWEGHPTSFAYHYPHVIAFEQQFIEIRSVIDGQLEQVIQEKNLRCLQSGKSSITATATKEGMMNVILGTMMDKSNSLYQQIFELQPSNLATTSAGCC